MSQHTPDYLSSHVVLGKFIGKDLHRVKDPESDRQGVAYLVSPFDGTWRVMWDPMTTDEWQADIIIEGVNDQDWPWDNPPDN